MCSHRVLFISNSSGGMYSFRKEIVECFTKGNEVFLSAPADSRADHWETIGCKFIPYEFDRHGKNPLNELKHIRYYSQLIKEIKPDLVFTYTIKPNIYGGIACARSSVPYIANVTGLGDAIENGGLLSKISTNLYKYGLRKASCVFFQNEVNRDLFVRHKIVTGKNRVIPGSGVNLNFHKFEEYPDSSDIVRFLFVARIKREKGIEELLSAIHTLRKEYSNCVVDVVGGCEDDYTEKLKEAEKEEDIVYHGQQSDMHGFYSKCHCVVLPSYHEGTSNVLLEGSATGRPIITTMVPGCQEILEEGKTGFGCLPKDVESLISAMKKFLSLPNDQKAQMGIAAREKVEREYDRQIVIDAYQEEMKNIIGRE